MTGGSPVTGRKFVRMSLSELGRRLKHSAKAVRRLLLKLGFALRVKPDTKRALDEKNALTPTQYVGTLNWVEPFATKKPQKLNLEIWTWTKGDRNFIFACVSPQARDTAIWNQLREIRDDYLKK